MGGLNKGEEEGERRWKEGERFEIKGEEMDFQTFLFVFCFWEGREGQNRAGRPRLLFLSFFWSFVSFLSFHFSPSEGIDDDDDLLIDGWMDYFVNDVSMDTKARRNYL